MSEGKNIQSVREGLRNWFEDLVRIDAWDADPPRHLFAEGSSKALPLPACSGIEYPVKDLAFVRDGVNTIYGRGVFTFGLVYRYAAKFDLHTLPTARVEAVAQYLMCQALLGLGGCDGIKNAAPAVEEFPVVVSRDGTDQDDWFVHAHIVLDVEFAVTEFALPPEFGPTGRVPVVPPEFRELTTRIYRSYSDDHADNTLDRETTLRATAEGGAV